MTITKVSTGLIEADAASVNLNIDENTLYIDVTTNRVGIGNTNPSTALDVTGSVTADGLTVGDTSDSQTIIQMLANSTNGANTIHFGDAASGAASYVGYINYAHDSNSMQFSANGVERLRIDSSGNVGIGTSPSTKLHVADGADSNAQIRINGSTSTVYSRLYSDNNGVLAIGTDGGNQAANSYMMFEVKGSERLRIDSLGGITGASQAGGHVVFNSNTVDADFRVAWNNGTHALYVDGATGNVGIGASSVSAPLHIKSSTVNAIFLQENGSPTTGTGQVGRFVSTTSNVTDALDSNGYYRIGGSTNPATGAGFSEYMRIDASGNVGIGVVPKSTWISGYAGNILQMGDAAVFGGSTNDSMAMMMANAYYDSVNSQWEYINTDFATRYEQLDGTHVWSTAASGSADTAITWSESMRIDASGNVGIGTSSITSNTILHMKDTDTQIELESTNGSNSAFIDFDGTNLQLSTNRNMIDGAFSNTGKSAAGIYLVGQSGGSLIRFATASADNTTPSTRMTLDASGNLLLNTTANAGGYKFRFNGVGAIGDTDSALKLGRLDANTAFLQATSDAGVAKAIAFMGASEYGRFDASGQLRLGNSAPAWDTTFSSLVTKGGFLGSQSALYLYSGQNGYYSGGWKYSTTAPATLTEQAAGAHIFYNAASGTAGNAISWSESMRIDASGNLLVGTTSAFGTTGTTINAAGLVYSSADGDRSGQFDRTTSDGEIARFTKAGTTVGTIGTQLDRLYIGSDDSMIFFDAGATNAIWPWTSTATSDGDADNTIDIGDSNNRFKDLYLSGKVQAEYIYRSGTDGSGLHFTTNAIYPTNENAAISDGTETLGAAAYRFKDLYLSGRAYINDGIKLDSGDGIYFGQDGTAANKLDDYEEGTWTPTLYYQNATGVTRTYTEQTGYYTKIGNTVTVWCTLLGATSNSGSYANDNMGISGLPFSVITTATTPVRQSGFAGTASVGTLYMQISGTTALLITPTSQNNLGDDLGAGATYSLSFSGSYNTTA
jgi:hypothetical protein